MNIAYTSSDAYSQYTGISMLSLFDNNRDVKDITVYIINMKISEQNIDRLISIAEEYGRKIVFINAEKKIEEFRKKYNLGEFHGGINSYSKIFPDVFLPNLDKVLFLDADTIINGNLEDLYNINLEGKILAAVPDVGVYFFGHEDRAITDKNEVYFNTGVILYNMKEVVRKKLQQRIISAKCRYGRNLRLADQSLLNLALNSDEGVRINFKYNMYVHTVPADLFKEYTCDKKDPWFLETVKEIISARKKPIIIHYVRGPRLGGRPWFKWNTSFYSSCYKKYWKKSPWKRIKRKSNIAETKRIKHILNKETKVDIPVLGTLLVLFEIYFSKYASRSQWERYQYSPKVKQIKEKIKSFLFIK